MRTDVEFPGFGNVTLRGWLYEPEQSGPSVSSGRWPAIVMAHGFSATRHMGLVGYAEAFAAAGFAVLVYDHRCLGDSDGEPRQEINPWAQARDYRYALTWLAAHPSVDPGRLGIWGSSFSGGEVLVVGAVDPRVRVVIANVPFAGDVPDASPDDVERLFAAMTAALADETGSGPADSDSPPIGPMAVILASKGNAPDAKAFLPQPESTIWFEAAGAQGSRWVNSFTLRGLGGPTGFNPALAVPFICPRPLLMVVATEDRVAPHSLATAAFAVAGEPRQLELIAGDHFVPYSGAALEQSSRVMVEFLTRYL